MKRTLLATAALALALPCAAAPFDDIAGSWHGAVTMDARNIANVHSVGPFSMNITGEGEVRAANANGCRLKGVVKKGLSQNLYDLRARMTGCHYESFNRRWTGHLAQTEDGRMRLALSVASRTTAEPEYLDASGLLAR